MFPQIRRLATGITAFALLAACASPDPLDQLAGEHVLVQSVIQSGNFTLKTLGKPLPKTVDHLRIYIGSDGQPWQGRVPASNPTGTRSLAAELMVQDPLPAMYLGRPCYHAAAIAAPCNAELWTSGRYSDTVIATMVNALNEIIERHQLRQLTLVGYSGGGVIALLSAARLTAARLSAARLTAARLTAARLTAAPPEPSLKILVITVAAPLDTGHWTRFHHLLPLSDSLNPREVVPYPAPFRQIHLVGRADRVVPASTVQSYLATHPDLKVLYVDDFDHICCWVLNWRQLLARIEA